MPEIIPAFSDGIMVLLLGEAYFTRSRLDQCLGASIEYSAPSERQAIANQSCSRAKLALLFLPRQAAQRCRHGQQVFGRLVGHEIEAFNPRPIAKMEA